MQCPDGVVNVHAVAEGVAPSWVPFGNRRGYCRLQKIHDHELKHCEKHNCVGGLLTLAVATSLRTDAPHIDAIDGPLQKRVTLSDQTRPNTFT